MREREKQESKTRMKCKDTLFFSSCFSFFPPGHREREREREREDEWEGEEGGKASTVG